jgi:hypothetical protein
VKCESKIAKIKRIEILTKFRRINVGDLEVLELLGYDEEGNVFSTLEGLRFEWSIAQPNLEIVPLKVESFKIELMNRIHLSSQVKQEEKLKPKTINQIFLS